MELYTEHRSIGVGHAFTSAVIGIDKADLCIGRQRIAHNGITVILAGNIDTACLQIGCRLIGTTMTIFQLSRLSSL